MAEADPLKSAQKRDLLERKLQSYLAAAPFDMRFPSEIDQYFENHGQQEQVSDFIKASVFGLIVFNLLAISDYCLMPGQALTIWIMRFLWATPLSLITLFWLPRKWSPRLRDNGLTTLLILLALGLGMATYAAQPLDNAYFSLQWLLLGLVGSALFPIRFRVAIILTVFLWLLYAATVLLSIKSTQAAAMTDIALMSALLLIGLETKRRAERNCRRSYALQMLDRIKRQRLEEINKKLSQQATYDALTGIYNRRALDKSYPRLWRHALRKQRPISVLFIDVDFFKRYNDTYGHACGDDCLTWLATLLQKAARRPLDFVARFGGEEFIVILPDTQAAEAGVFAEQVRALVTVARKPHQGSPEKIVTVSIGVSGGIPRREENENLYLEQADQALYQAKSRGRNQAAFYREKVIHA